MRRSLTLCLLFTGVISIAGCGGASFLSNSQSSGQSSTQSSAISTVNVTCSPSSVPAGGAAQCQAKVSGSGAYSSEVAWSVDMGTISNSGLYTAPTVISGTASATVTATSKQDKNKSGKGVLSFGSSSNTASISAISVAATPSSITLGQTATCKATVSGSGNYSTAVNWTATGGSITQAGVFTPSGIGTGTCTATSAQDSTKSATASIAVSSTSTPVSVTGVTVTANPSSVSTSQTTTCVANVSGTGAFSNSVTWSATGGTITQSGVFTPSGVGTGACIATSTQSGYTNVSGQAAINVTGTSTATSSSLSVSATTISFGIVNLNTTATQSITLTATGTTAVTISGASVSGTGFSVSGATFPITLNPNQTAQVFVAFDPTVAGSATGQLNITSNATSGATALVNLTGSGQGVSYQVNLNWSAPASSPDPVAGYDIFRAPTGTTAFQQVNTSAVTTTSYVDGSVQNGTTYDYVVRSVDAVGAVSDPSNIYTAAIPN